MAFQLSPGVRVTERDLTLVVPSVSTTAGAFAGTFQWGPVDEVVTIDSEQKLVKEYGLPNSNTFVSFFTAANFLAYGNNLQINRAVERASAVNAVGAANAEVAASATLVKNEDDYITNHSAGSATIAWFAKNSPVYKREHAGLQT